MGRPTVLRTIRQVRLQRDLTLADLADVSAVPKATLSQIERGRMVATSAELAAISQALQVPLENRAVPCTEEAVP